MLNRAKNATSKNIWIEGGANVAQQFLERGLIDEIILPIAPAILGEGIRLFGRTTSLIELSFLEAKTFAKVLVQLIYVRNQP